MKYLKRITLVVVLLSSLAACGGGGSDPDPGSAKLADCKLGISTIGNCKL